LPLVIARAAKAESHLEGRRLGDRHEIYGLARSKVHAEHVGEAEVRATASAMVGRPAVERHASLKQASRLALNPQEPVHRQMNHHVIGMAITDRRRTPRSRSTNVLRIAASVVFPFKLVCTTL
jgi:hypothetical protein